MRDSEALVLNSHGSVFTCQLPNNQVFKTDRVEDTVGEIKVGEIISYKYLQLNSVGIPIAPVIIKIRSDLTWNDVIAGHFPQILQKKSLKDIVESQGAFLDVIPHHIPRYWTKDEGINMRKFMNNFAKNRNLDPLNPCDWYTIRRQDVADSGGATIFDHFGRFANTIIKLYPEIGATLEGFKIHQNFFNGKWKSEHNRREFFAQFAKANGFEPLHPEPWYNVSPQEIMQLKGGRSVLSYHKGSYFLALIELYYEIGFQKQKFLRKF